MAKRIAKKTNAKISARSYQTLRKDLMKRLKGVDATILVQVVQLGKTPGTDFFSDWGDSYNRDTWYKTWGKAEAVDAADLRGIVVQPAAVGVAARGAAGRRAAKRRS
jgi:hypothetical protein